MPFIIEADTIEELAGAASEFLNAIGNGNGDAKSAVAAARKGARKAAKDGATVPGAPIDPATVPQPIAPPGAPVAGFAPPPAPAAPQGVPDFSPQLTSPPPAFQPPAFAAPAAAPTEAPAISECRRLIDNAIKKHGQPAIYENYIHKNLKLQAGLPYEVFSAQVLPTLPAEVIQQLTNAMAAA